jgi:hypothetical protein
MCGCVNWRWWWISRARFASSFFALLSTTCCSQHSALPLAKASAAHLGGIAELVRRQVDFAKAALAYKFPEGVVPDRLQIGRGEFTVPGQPTPCEIPARTYSSSCLYELASCYVPSVSKCRSSMLPFVAAHEPLSPATGGCIPSSSGPESQPGL